MSKKKVRILVEIGEESGGRRGWVKHVTRIDESKDDGFAFEGEFLREGTREVPEGALILDCWPTGSRTANRKVASLSVATENGLDEIARVEDWHSESLELRDAAIAHLSASPSREDLIRERQALVARIAEIDALLGN